MGSRKTSLARRLDLDAERVGARLILAEFTKEIEACFKQVLVPEPISTVNAGMLALKAPGGPVSDDIAINTAIPFVVITSDINGRECVLHQTHADAIAAWGVNVAAYLAAHARCSVLFWRVRPEIDYDSFFDTRKRGWKVYSRLAVY